MDPTSIPLTNGGHALIDTEDLHLVAPYSWYRNSAGYAVTRIDGETIYMQRVVMCPTGDQVVSRTRGSSKVNNRRQNLKILPGRAECTRQFRIGTHHNPMDGPRAKTRSGFKGVYWCETGQQWSATICRPSAKPYDQNYTYLGGFPTAQEAAAAYNEAARKLHPGGCYLNPIGEPVTAVQQSDCWPVTTPGVGS